MKLTRSEDHIYRNERGDIYISVTQHLQMAGLIDYSQIHPQVLETAAERGNHVHAACNLYLQDDLDMESIDESYAGYVDAFIKFCKECDLMVWESEEYVYSNELKTAGAFDFTGSLGFDKHQTGNLIEIKTTAVYADTTTAIQVAGYVHLGNKARERKLFKGWGLHLRKNGTYRLQEVDIKKYDPWFQSMAYINWCAIADGLIPIGGKMSPSTHILCNQIIQGGK